MSTPEKTQLTEAEHKQGLRLSRLNFYCLTLALIGIALSGLAADAAFDKVVLFSGSFICLMSAWLSLRRVTLFDVSEHTSPQQMLFHFLTSVWFFYVIGYKGLWRFVDLRHGFSVGVIVSGALYVGVGLYANARWHDLVNAAVGLLDCTLRKLPTHGLYVQIQDGTQGPFTVEQLKALLAVGTITPMTLCCHEDAETWQPVAAYLR